jgi:uncharacterized protein YndB with AHSA1/START domain
MASTFTVERSTTIDAPPGRVYEQLVDFRNWPAWSPWEQLDPAMRRTYSGAASGTGAVYEWSGNRKAGQGRMEITDAVEPTSVRIDLRFDKPFPAQNVSAFTVEPRGTSSFVTWRMTGPLNLVMRVIGVVRSMDAMVGPDFEKGLAALKAVTERPS